MQIAIYALHNARFLGTCTETAKAHIYYVIMAGALALRKSVERHGQIAVAMARQLGIQETIAYCEFNHAIGIELCGDIIRGHKLTLSMSFPF